MSTYITTSTPTTSASGIYNTVKTTNPVFTASSLVWNGATTYSPSSVVDVSQRGMIDLKGQDADIILNGESLKETLVALKERLAWMVINPALEEQFSELKEIGDAYRKLEAECKEKMRVWNTLKTEKFD